MKFTFGKYKGQQLKDVTDRNYLEWLLENIEWLSDESKQAISNRLVNIQPLSNKKGTKLIPQQISLLQLLLQQELSEWESNFVTGVLNYGYITEKQKEVVRTLSKKVWSTAS